MFSSKINELRLSLSVFNKIYANKDDYEIFLAWLEEINKIILHEKPYIQMQKNYKIIKKKNKKWFDIYDCWEIPVFANKNFVFNNICFDQLFIQTFQANKKYYVHVMQTIEDIMNGDSASRNVLLKDIRQPVLLGVYKACLSKHQRRDKNSENEKGLENVDLLFCVYYKRYLQHDKGKKAYRILHFLGIHSNITDSLSQKIENRITEILNECKKFLLFLYPIILFI